MNLTVIASTTPNPGGSRDFVTLLIYVHLNPKHCKIHVRGKPTGSVAPGSGICPPGQLCSLGLFFFSKLLVGKIILQCCL